MSPSRGAGEPQAPSSRRLRTLLHTAPIHALEDNKSHWDGDWSAYDLRRLQVAAIEATLDHQGVEGGISRQSLKDSVAAVAAQMAPGGARRDHLEAAERVLGHLLNEAPGSDFVYPYTDRDRDGSWERRLHPVKILDQRQTEDGSLVVRASVEAINLLIGALDLDIADAQKAEERLLDEYIRAGRLDAAQATAEIARLRSIQYQTHISDFLRVVRQDIGRIDWSGRVLDEIRAAGQHLEQRSAEEASMRGALLEHLEQTADPDRRQALLDVADLVMDCHRRHRSLHSLIMRAEEEIPAEQVRQRFAPPAAIDAVSMSADVLHPLLALARPAALTVVTDFFVRLAGPRPAELMDLFHLLDALLAPRREAAEEALALEELDLEEPGPAGEFGAEVEAAARAVLDTARQRPVRVSEMLREARRSPGGDDAAQLVRLSALWAFAPDASDPATSDVVPEGMRSVRDGAELDDPDFAGDDLLVDARPFPRVESDG
jgi:hypothetical protein